jgi:hypothetical protein
LAFFQGNFSTYLLRNSNLLSFILIDPWQDGPIISGDGDGNDVRSYSGLELYQNITKKFAGRNEVVVMRKNSVKF